MKEYLFVQNTSYREFERQCSGLLRDGWTAQGGICVVVSEDGTFFHFQAFVK